MTKCRDCPKIASYNFEGMTPKYCKIHLLEGMVDVSSKRCELCTKFPNWNDPGEITTRMCGDHREPDMVIVRKPCCKEPGCKLTASYADPGESTPIFCSIHHKPGMESTVRKCAFEGGCKRVPSFNVPGSAFALYCKKHSDFEMVDVKNKAECAFEDCSTRPSYNVEGEKAKFCLQHRETNMIDVANKACKEEGCPILPSFNFKCLKNALYCAEHKKIGMQDIRAKRCEEKGCFEIPEFNIEGELKGLYCLDHKHENMINVMNPRCRTPNCGLRSYLQHNYYCIECFAGEYPGIPLPKCYQIKEHHVRTFVEDNFAKKCVSISFDKAIKGAKSRLRPDILMQFETHSIIVEVDERQHRSNTYTEKSKSDNERSDILFNELGCKPLVIIRFNPDAYVNSEKETIPSCFNRGNCSAIVRVEKVWKARLAMLKKHIKSYMGKISFTGLKTVHLYFDGFD